jgi:hypothetical protein
VCFAKVSVLSGLKRHIWSGLAQYQKKTRLLSNWLSQSKKDTASLKLERFDLTRMERFDLTRKVLAKASTFSQYQNGFERIDFLHRFGEFDTAPNSKQLIFFEFFLVFAFPAGNVMGP